MGKKVIQVPNAVITNIFIPHYSFALYVQLKMFAFSGNNIRIYARNLKEAMQWKDGRTLKKHINILYEQGLISDNLDNIDYFRPFETQITEIEKKNFTQVDVETIKDVIEETKQVQMQTKDRNITIVNLKEMAIRLFYFYEMLYNPIYGNAFPSFNKICNELHISASHLSALNKRLHEKGLLIVKNGGWYIHEGENAFVPRRYNNSYIPLLRSKKR